LLAPKLSLVGGAHLMRSDRSPGTEEPGTPEAACTPSAPRFQRWTGIREGGYGPTERLGPTSLSARLDRPTSQPRIASVCFDLRLRISHKIRRPYRGSASSSRSAAGCPLHVPAWQVVAGRQIGLEQEEAVHAVAESPVSGRRPGREIHKISTAITKTWLVDKTVRINKCRAHSPWEKLDFRY
jgi:hypothetical protein